jgi:hypothetical protein
MLAFIESSHAGGFISYNTSEILSMQIQFNRKMLMKHLMRQRGWFEEL